MLPFVSSPNKSEISLTVRFPSLFVSSSSKVCIASSLFSVSASILRMNSFCLKSIIETTGEFVRCYKSKIVKMCTNFR